MSIERLEMMHAAGARMALEKTIRLAQAALESLDRNEPPNVDLVDAAVTYDRNASALAALSQLPEGND